MKEKILFDGLTRSSMIHRIHGETDTSTWCYRSSDEELIEGYKSIFGMKD